MAQKNFKLSAQVSSDNLAAIKACLKRIIGDRGTVTEMAQGFNVEAKFQGETAADLNRAILSELRRAEKRTRIRAEWASGGTVERFFDYVPKGTRQAQRK